MRNGYSQHNKVTMPGAVFFVVLGTALIVFGALTARRGDLGIGVICDLWVSAVLWVVLAGQGNPWWMRSRLDPPRSRAGDRER